MFIQKLKTYLNSDLPQQELLISLRNNIKQHTSFILTNLDDLFSFIPQATTFCLQILANFFSEIRDVDFAKFLPQINLISPATENAKIAFNLFINNFFSQFKQIDEYTDKIYKLKDFNFNLETIKYLLKQDIQFGEKDYQKCIEYLSKVKYEDEICISEAFLLQMREEMNKILEIEVEYKEFGIPYIQKQQSVELKADFFTNIGIVQQKYEQKDENDIEDIGRQKVEFQLINEFLTEDDYNKQKQYSEQINNKIKNQIIIDEQQLNQLLNQIQIIEHFTSVESNPYRSKQIAEIFYYQLTYIIKYQFFYQKPIRGRFNFFFGYQVPKVRVSLLKIITNISFQSPLCWDLIRCYELLPIMLLARLGDGETIAVKEVCEMCIHFTCSQSLQNRIYLEHLSGQKLE